MAGQAITTMLDIFLRMAIDTPRHSHRGNTGNSIHCLDGTVAFLTGDARLHVALVRKVNIVRKIVHFNPRYGFTIFPVSNQLQDLRAFADTGYKVMTSHAFADTGYARNRRPVGIDVAMLTRNFVVRSMHCVAEFDGLNRTAIGEIFAMYPCAKNSPTTSTSPSNAGFFAGCSASRTEIDKLYPLLFGARVCP